MPVKSYGHHNGNRTEQSCPILSVKVINIQLQTELNNRKFCYQQKVKILSFIITITKICDILILKHKIFQESEKINHYTHKMAHTVQFLGLKMFDCITSIKN